MSESAFPVCAVHVAYKFLASQGWIPCACELPGAAENVCGLQEAVLFRGPLQGLSSLHWHIMHVNT